MTDDTCPCWLLVWVVWAAQAVAWRGPQQFHLKLSLHHDPWPQCSPVIGLCKASCKREAAVQVSAATAAAAPDSEDLLQELESIGVSCLLLQLPQQRGVYTVPPKKGIALHVILIIPTKRSNHSAF